MLGDHKASGYQPFWFLVPKSVNTDRQIIIVADNRFNHETAPTHTGL